MKRFNDAAFLVTIVEAVDFRKIFQNFTLGFCMCGTNVTNLYARTVKGETVSYAYGYKSTRVHKRSMRGIQ